MPNSPTWTCVDCGWSGWSLNNTDGTKLSEWECPICKSVGKIRILGLDDHGNYLVRNKTYKAEISYGEQLPNAMCMKCGWTALFIHTYSY